MRGGRKNEKDQVGLFCTAWSFADHVGDCLFDAGGRVPGAGPPGGRGVRETGGNLPYDGMPQTFKLTSTTSVANGWKYMIEFDSQHAGYGNRMGQMMAQMITHHVALVTVESGRVTVAVMDGKWDMMKGQLIQ